MLNRPADYIATTAEVADYLHVSRRTLIRWRGVGEGPPYLRRGVQIGYRRADVDAWLASRRVVPVRETPTDGRRP
jgi:excisionase family DNA binding protein